MVYIALLAVRIRTIQLSKKKRSMRMLKFIELKQIFFLAIRSRFNYRLFFLSVPCTVFSTYEFLLALNKPNGLSNEHNKLEFKNTFCLANIMRIQLSSGLDLMVPSIYGDFFQ